MRTVIGIAAGIAVALAAPRAFAGDGGTGAKAPPDAEAGAEKDLAARVDRLLGMARKAFEARDYGASRGLALAACQLRPENEEAQALHRLSIRYAERLAALRGGPGRSGNPSETPDEAVERLSGPAGALWREAPKGTRARPPADPLRGEKPDWQVRIERKMAEPGTAEFKGMPFSEVKEYFEAVLGCPIVVDRRLRDRVMVLPVSFKAKDMPAGQMFRWVVENDLGLRFSLADGAVYVSDADGICEKTGITVVYDVEDLVYPSEMPDFVAPELGLPEANHPGWGVNFDTDDRPAPAPKGMTPERLKRVIERTVDPGTWKDGG